MTTPPTQGSPAAVVLEYLESHDTISVREARELCSITWDNAARVMLNALESRRLISRAPGARKGGRACMRGPLFGRWRQFMSNGFQTDVLTGAQFGIPGFLRPGFPGSR
jgi:hypothetical protein